MRADHTEPPTGTQPSGAFSAQQRTAFKKHDESPILSRSEPCFPQAAQTHVWPAGAIQSLGSLMLTPFSVDTAAMETPTAVSKPGWKTSEFWVTVGFIVLTHAINIFRSNPGVAGTVATIAGDALAATGYSVARGLAKAS